jgi:flagellar biosynthesis activator protein FlaF
MQRLPNNPYIKTQKQTAPGRDVEVNVLEKAAVMLKRCQESWTEDVFSRELDDALRYNQKIWDVFQTDWRSPECQLTREMRENLLSLGIFVRKTSLDLIAYPKKEKLNSLIQINQNLAAGLKAQRDAERSNAQSG